MIERLICIFRGHRWHVTRGPTEGHTDAICTRCFKRSWDLTFMETWRGR